MYSRRLKILSSGDVMKIHSENYEDDILHDSSEQTVWAWIDEKPMRDDYVLEKG
jgi:hypothetical protein